MLRLLELPDAVLEMLKSGELSAGHAKALLGLEDEEKMEPLAQRIIERGMSVRDVEAAVKKANETKFEEEEERVHPQIRVYMKELERKAYQMAGGNFKAPSQKYIDFKNDKITTSDIKCSYLPGVTGVNLNSLFSKYVSDSLKEGMETFGRKIKGFDGEEAVFIAPETHSSSPIRMNRGENMESNVNGIYPCGEGAGYAGGITSSAVDGIKVALSIYGKEKENG
jgi:uncharacterized FAD-dependent dehydrogenase